MTPPTTWATGAVLTGLLAAGMPSTAGAATTPSPTADAMTQTADAVSKCLTDHGYPALPTSSALAPALSGPSGSLPAITLPTAGATTLPTAAGTTLPTAAGTSLPTAAGTTLPTAGTTSGGGAAPAVSGALQCGQLIINNNLYLVTVTTTTTTTTVDAPITSAAGSISTTTSTPASPAEAPPAATFPAAVPAISAIGRPLGIHRSTRAGHKRGARARHVVRVRLSGRPGDAKRVVRVRLVRKGYATRR